MTGVLSCDDFGDCASGRITIVEHVDPANWEDTAANVVFSYDPNA
jgi:hypothetical protein